MQRCAFCGSEFPDHARFCGQCGRAPVATLDAPTTLSSAQARPVPKKAAEEEEERQRRAFLLDLSFSPGGGRSLSMVLFCRKVCITEMGKTCLPCITP